MKVEIIINRAEANHLKSPHTFYDGCGTACDILRRVQKKIDKKLKEEKNK